MIIANQDTVVRESTQKLQMLLQAYQNQKEITDIQHSELLNDKKLIDSANRKTFWLKWQVKGFAILAFGGGFYIGHFFIK